VQIIQICTAHVSIGIEPTSAQIGGSRALAPGQRLSLTVIRSQDRRVTCRLCVPQQA
jgi:hypothetical protein